MKTTVLFDLDNTLIDRDKGVCDAYRAFAYETVPTDMVERVVQELMKRDDNGDAIKAKVFQEVKDLIGLPQEWVEQGLHFFYYEYPKYASVFPRSRETLLKLREKYRIGLLSNGRADMQYVKLRTAGLEDCFDMILISGDTNYSKPDKEIFLEACRRIGCKPEEAYYVGDIPWRDIVGAENAGLTPIHIWRNDNNPCPGHIHIYQIEELLDIL